ncbi:MAG: leucine-rich repeat domain-containing protein [Holosporaceae bacterium]
MVSLMLQRFAVFFVCCSVVALNCYGIELDFLFNTTIDVTNWQQVEAYLRDRQIDPDHVTKIDFEGHNLTHIPHWVFTKTKNVRNLDLTCNRLTALPDKLSQLRDLEVLTAPQNQISVVDPAISQLTKLKELNLGHNNLNDLPTTIGDIGSLQCLFLENNDFVLLPGSICNLAPHLQRLSVRNNPLGAKDEGSAVGKTTLMQTFGHHFYF